MSKRDVSYAEISAFIHVTEDSSKVRSAILKILPEQLTYKVEFTQISMRGHHGNPIVELKIKITNRRDAYEALQGILSRLSPLDETLLDEELAKHLDARHHLYLRLDKQRAFLGETALASSDAISLMFHLRSHPKSLKELKTDLSTDEKHGDGTDASL
jgi:hypothetical protein